MWPRARTSDSSDTELLRHCREFYSVILNYQIICSSDNQFWVNPKMPVFSLLHVSHGNKKLTRLHISVNVQNNKMLNDLRIKISTPVSCYILEFQQVCTHLMILGTQVKFGNTAVNPQEKWVYSCLCGK